ncbi:MAG: YvcK family protein [Anaerolineaceae bacterium]|nr:MAG: YvcK family protein [Anaerolineaceae bacterium]
MTRKWLIIGIGVKRWIVLGAIGNLSFALGIVLALDLLDDVFDRRWLAVIALWLCGLYIIATAFYKLSRNLLAPYRRYQHGRVVDVVYAHRQRGKGLKVVAIGGGTGLPAVLRGLKAHTSNITAIVTVADDGGSSGQLRRALGVLPPGDLRSNVVALADDESLMTQLFQYRFNHGGDLGGHAFGNLFIAALAGISGGLDVALPEIERVLNIQGRVLPSTLDDVELVAKVRLRTKNRVIRVQGESKIGQMDGRIEEMMIVPPDAMAYHQSVQAILEADLIVIGPGSLYTSILPNLLVKGIQDALEQSKALKVYVCNVATQPGETTQYSVADHVLALEKYIGEDVLQVVLANSATPPANSATHYVAPAPDDHPVRQRYHLHYTDLTDVEHPWRHDPKKLAHALIKLLDERTGYTEYTVSDPLNIED